MAEPDDKWHVSGFQGYSGRAYWCIWKYQAGVYGNQRFVLTPNGYDRKRFYSQDKANTAADKMNAKEPTA